jgi:hypothetical protein
MVTFSIGFCDPNAPHYVFFDSQDESRSLRTEGLSFRGTMIGVHNTGLRDSVTKPMTPSRWSRRSTEAILHSRWPRCLL